MHRGLCVCAALPRIVTRTRVVLVIHHVEDRKSTNTGRIAAACLPESRVVVRGRPGDVPSPPLVEDGSVPLVLFPHEDAEPLVACPPEPGAPPVTLVVPDGTWRQASKVRGRVPELAGARAVTLPPGPPSRYLLREGAHAGALGTLEAVARALGILEGPAVQEALEAVLDAFVQRTLWVKGDLADGEVRGGLPAAARRHDPLSGLGPARSEVEAPARPGRGQGATR